jgi:hypothetical protein
MILKEIEESKSSDLKGSEVLNFWDFILQGFSFLFRTLNSLYVYAEFG